jgi:hypothetical protein
MSSRGRGSWLALQSDGRELAFVPGNNRRRGGATAVGKPDKTTLSELLRKDLCAPGRIARSPQSRLQTALPLLNRPSTAKPLPNTLFCRQTK